MTHPDVFKISWVDLAESTTIFLDRAEKGRLCYLYVMSRQAKRFPGEDFAIQTRHLKGIDIEKGMDAFHDTSFARRYFGGQFESKANVFDFYDGVVWTDNATKRFPTVGDPAYYLPKICGSK